MVVFRAVVAVSVLVASVVHAAAAAAAAAVGHAAPTVPPPPNLCSLKSATFKIWDAKCCKGAGTGKLIPGGDSACDGVTMESSSGMAATYRTEPFLIEPTTIYNATWEACPYANPDPNPDRPRT